MLKAHVDNEIRLIQQPHHAQVSGYLAAHWGGRSGFAPVGTRADAAEPSRLRDEAVLAVAEHDNGWWETEAMPRISDRDGLPVGVGEAARPSEHNELDAWHRGGFDRWRLGIDRVAGPHPYAALLISMHPYWLYAVAFEDLMPSDAEHLRHFVFGAPDVSAGLVSDRAKTRVFLDELDGVQEDLRQRIRHIPGLAGALDPNGLAADFRLLQLFDSMSLYLALDDRDAHELPHIPRSSWADRCTITWRRRDSRTIEIAPYPFDTDSLRVPVLMRIAPHEDRPGNCDEPSPLIRFHAMPMRTIEFTFVSREG